MLLTFLLIFTIAVGAIIALTLVHSIYVIKQAEVVVIERFGRFHTILRPGLHIVTPFVDVPRVVAWSFFREVEGKRFYRYTKVISRLDLRETVYDFPNQNVITKDNVAIEISALLYYQIVDPKAAVYEVANLSEAIEKLTHSTLRNIIGAMDLDECLVSRDRINTKLRLILDDATEKWGVKVNRVELQEINPPLDIRHAMEKQMRAEREKRAIILEAEGAKRSAILKAEGDQESQVLSARGSAESQVLRAQAEATARLAVMQAEAKAIELIQQAVPQHDPTQYLIALQYIKALPKMTEGQDNKLIVVPYDAAGMMGSLATIKELFQPTKK